MARPPKDELHGLYHGERLSLRQISERLGVSKHTVSRWMKELGIQTRSISEGTSMAQTGRPLSEAHKASLAKNLAVARSKITPESLQKHSEAMKGKTPWNKGKTTPPEVRAKIKASWARDPERKVRARDRMTGPNAPWWKGGVKSDLARRLDTSEWRALRQEIYARDNWTCQDCGRRCKNTKDSKGDGKAKIQCHHIVSRRDGGSDESANLVTLCMSCHHQRERAKKDPDAAT